MKIRTVALIATSLCLSAQAFAEVSLTTGAGYANMAQLPEARSQKTSAAISAK